MDKQFTFRIELCYDSLDCDPFFTTESTHPWSIAVGDQIDGDPKSDLQRNERITLARDQRLVVVAIRHYLFANPSRKLPARNLRIAVSLRQVS